MEFLCCRTSYIVYLKQNVLCWFDRAWFSAHLGCSFSREHVASTQGFDWLLSKPTFLSQMAGWGDVPTGSKNNGLNQPKAENQLIHVRCATCHKNVDRSWHTRAWIHGGTRVCKARFQDAVSQCSAGFYKVSTNPVCLYPAVSCILGLNVPVSA